MSNGIPAHNIAEADLGSDSGDLFDKKNIKNIKIVNIKKVVAAKLTKDRDRDRHH